MARKSVSLLLEGGEILQQIAVHEHVATADLAKEDESGRIIEKMGIVTWYKSIAVQDMAQNEMLENAVTAIEKPVGLANERRNRQPCSHAIGRRDRGAKPE